MNIGLLVALTAFQGFVVAFNQPARLALVPSLVPEKDLGAAVAINSVIFNTARFVGPMFAGVAIVWSGVAATFAANALSYVVFLFALTRIRVAPTVAETAEHGSFAADLREGIRYTATHPGIAPLLLLLIALGIGGRPLNELLPGFAADVFRSGAGGLSILASAIGGGAILGGVWLAHRAHASSLFTSPSAVRSSARWPPSWRSRPSACGSPSRPLWCSDSACRPPGSRSRRSFNSPPTATCAGA